MDISHPELQRLLLLAIARFSGHFSTLPFLRAGGAGPGSDAVVSRRLRRVFKRRLRANNARQVAQRCEQRGAPSPDLS